MRAVSDVSTFWGMVGLGAWRLCEAMTQVKIERWHHALKNRVLLENYYLPGDLEAQVGAFVDRYEHRRIQRTRA